MSNQTKPRWMEMRTEETLEVERVLRSQFSRTDAYRYNSASIRVRVIDPRFEGKSTEDRDAMVEPLLEQLPEQTQADIMNLLTLAPSETASSFKKMVANEEFEDPSRSVL